MRKLGKLLVIAAAIVALAAPAVNAADHLDAPTVKTNGAIDINDVYVFAGADAANTVLTFTVNPAAGVISGTTFDAAAEYRILVDTNGDEAEDITFLFDFAAVVSGTQAYTVTRNGVAFAAGTTGSNMAIATGGQVFAGLVDDPFFFDLNGFNNFKKELLLGNLDLSQICNVPVDSNFFAGFNGSAIALELPDADLGTTIGVWAETRIDEGSGLVQVERMGKPAINTVFNHTDPTKDGYNRADPAADTADYTDDVAGTVSLIRQELGDSVATADAYGATVAGLLLPDVISYDTSTAANYAMLNGRALTDDVINISYSVVTMDALKDDCVANDSAFKAAFPYYAGANMVPDTATQPTPTSTGLPLMLGVGAILLVGGVAGLALRNRRIRS